MGDWHDYVALEWVKGEIADTFRQARLALEAYVESPQDQTDMRSCLTYIHQVHGTLQMVEFFGAALLAEEMERLAQALLEQRVSNRNEALQVMMQAILQMPAYLDRVQSARRDLPMVVLPLLNDLRAARDESLLSETSLFTPDLSVKVPALSSTALARLDGEDLVGHLRKLRQMLQQSLVNVIRDQDVPASLGHMARVFASLESLCKDSPLAALWKISSGVIEGLVTGSIDNGTSVRNLLREVDKELKRLIEQGSAGINQPAPEELLKNLLFYVAKASSRSPRIVELKAEYRLDQALPDSLDGEQAALGGLDRDALRSVVAALREELVRVKDTLDLFVRSDRKPTAALGELLVPLKQIADTLAVLGFGQLRKVILDQWETLCGVSTGEHEPNYGLLMDVAGSLLYVEATLAGMAGPTERAVREENDLPSTDVAQIHQVVIKEARNGLEQAKDAIIEFISSQWDPQRLACVPELLTQVRGGLVMIPLPRAAGLVALASGYIQEELLLRKIVPNWQSLDTLADALTGIEYYLERVAEDRIEQGDRVLDIAEERLDRLGYFLRKKTAILDATSAPAIPPGDPLLEIDVLAAAPQAAFDQTVALDRLFVKSINSVSRGLQEPVAACLPKVITDEADAEAEIKPARAPAEDASAEGDERFVALDERDAKASQWNGREIVGLQAGQETLHATPAEEIMCMAEGMAAPEPAINPPAQHAPPGLLPPPADEAPMDEEFQEVFVEEAAEVLETIAKYLPKWCADSGDKAAVAEIRRAFHTLKGSGRMVRALVIGELAWSIENMLNRVLDRSIQPAPVIRQTIASTHALLPELIAEYAANAQRQRDDVDHLAAQAHALAAGAYPASAQPVESDMVLAGPVVAAELPDMPSRDENQLDPQLVDIFRNEAMGHLDTLQQYLACCAEALPQPITDDLQRALHTLKGSAYMAGILPIAEIAAPLEKLVKELKPILGRIGPLETGLLHDTVELIQHGLKQLDKTPLATIKGSVELVERIQRHHHERLESLQAERQSSTGAPRDPQLISLFLEQGMDILLDAEQLLQRWRAEPAERQELNALLDALTTLGRGAAMAELPQIEVLCQSLLDNYAAVQAGRLPVSVEFFQEAEIAHEALIGMMDQVAAGMEVQPQPQRVAALRALLDQSLTDSDSSKTLSRSDAAAVIKVINLTDSRTEPVQLSRAEIEQSAQPPAAFESAERDDEFDQEMLEIFLEEAGDLLVSSGNALDKWLADYSNTAACSLLLRDLHTLKGGARLAGIRPLGDLAHELESLYEAVGSGVLQPSTDMAELLHQSHDLLAALVDQLQLGQPLGTPRQLIRSIQAFRKGEKPSRLTDGWAQDETAPAESEIVEPLENKAVDESMESAGSETAAAGPADLAPWRAYATAAAPATVDEQDVELVELFLEEAFDIIHDASVSLQSWVSNVDNRVALKDLQRNLHTLKGGARMAEMAALGDLAHELEFLYEGLGNGRLHSGSELFGLLNACHDCLAEMLESVRSRQPGPDGRDLIEAIRRFLVIPSGPLHGLGGVPAQLIEDVRIGQPAEQDILEIFVEEADELLQIIGAMIDRWRTEPGHPATASQLQRALHTLKGGARLAGQSQLGNLAQTFEQRLIDVEHNAGALTLAQVGDAELAYQGLREAIEVLRQKVSATAQPARKTQSRTTFAPAFDLNILAASPRSNVQDRQVKVLPFVRRAKEIARETEARRLPQELVRVPADLLEELVNLAGETSIFRSRVEQQVSQVGIALGEMQATIERVRDQLRRLDIETQAQILSRYQTETDRSGHEEFDLLEMDRHSQLQQLSRALFESASDLLDLKETLTFRNRDAETLLLQQARVNTELQEGLMRTRMVPFERLVPRLRRIVRQVAGELGKPVEFLIGNAEGEMDRTVLERILSPLEHMLRNAVDHGIEPATVRRAAGKPEIGTIRMTICREGGDILLSLSDDGGGIRLDAVRRKAIERGMMKADSSLSDEQILQFILAAGLSTAEKVTQISGRGVGLDVVYSEVKQLGGSMRIESTPGEGTRFLIRLPFTVSVNRALMVLSGEDLYAIPLNTIEGIVRVSPYELEALYQSGEGQDGAPRFEYAGQLYDLRYLGDMLGNGLQPKLAGQMPLPVILARSSEHALAVQVDSLAGSREIVVKSLGRQFAGVHAISGATILGDGRVVVILDLLASIRAMQANLFQVLPRSNPQAQLPNAGGKSRPTQVMVVDDSITVRKVTSRLLERAGMTVVSAKDGVDAIAKLQDLCPDIMLLDIEMPRMDGFELATLVRHDERLKDLPIVMITSRTGEKHRQRALTIGVNEYLGKPYQESLLLEIINELVKGNG